MASIAEKTASIDMVPKPPISPRPPQTPPSSRELPADQQGLTMKHVQQFLELLKINQANQTLPGLVQTPDRVAEKHAAPVASRTRASRLEFKSVDER